MVRNLKNLKANSEPNRDSVLKELCTFIYLFPPGSLGDSVGQELRTAALISSPAIE